ncbi:MAG: hypothetical protein ABIU85_00155 [Methylotenera sp.]
MNKLIIILAALIISTPALAAPKKTEADKWYKDFRAAKDKVFDSLFIKATNEHYKFNGKLVQITERAEKLFGQPMTSELANCTVVAMDLQTAWQNMADLSRAGLKDTSNLPNIAQSAWSGGEKYGTCLNELDKLK